ncbi:MAG: protein translocase subunit SecD [bacterium]|nr:protein translocase subunit SecD [bacterium]
MEVFMLEKLRKPKTVLLLILLLSVVCLAIDLPKTPLKIHFWKINWEAVVGGYELNLFGGKFYRDLKVKEGLDIRGGMQVVLEAEMKDIPADRRQTALDAARNVVERRVNFFGVAEPNVQTSRVGESWRIVVELPGVSEPEKVIALIGQTAQLDFREVVEVPTDNPPTQTVVSTGLTGKDLKKASVTFEQTKNTPQVAIEFTDEGAKKFSDITGRLVGKPLAIFLDQVPLSAPTVQEKIEGGKAVITGQFNLEQAKKLAIQLNAGALPVPIKILQDRQIGATLGQEAVQKSLVAGIIGLALVALFMAGIYGRLGVLADIALVVYGLITLALYKLIPVTLTLAGIAGFLLSIGMAVDANILIFERIKEEIRAGKPKEIAMELGFGRAWDSIRDANICTIITAFVLFNPFNWSFLNSSGMVRGFALTLGLGIAISLFTGIVVTRNLVRVFYKGGQ